ncbi:MAG: ComEA family DNA-binding protein [Acidimicrobiales bacterium]
MLDPTAAPSDDGDGPLRRPAPPRTWRERLDDLADATGSSPARIAGGAVLVALALAGALWLLRPPPSPSEASLPFTTTTVPGPATTATTQPTVVVVHVAGAVRAPGIHELAADARVTDAIDAAGGLSPDADAARINLAAPVTDGSRVYVPAVGEEPPPVAVGGTGTTPDGPSGPVDLNTADAEALDALPGIGPATAAAILEHRSKVGRFTAIEQLLDVPGIGEAKLEALRDLVTV